MTSGYALTILSSVIKRVLTNRVVRMCYAAERIDQIRSVQISIFGWRITGAYGPGMYRTVVCIVLKKT